MPTSCSACSVGGGRHSAACARKGKGGERQASGSSQQKEGPGARPAPRRRLAGASPAPRRRLAGASRAAPPASAPAAWRIRRGRRRSCGRPNQRRRRAVAAGRAGQARRRPPLHRAAARRGSSPRAAPPPSAPRAAARYGVVGCPTGSRRPLAAAACGARPLRAAGGAPRRAASFRARPRPRGSPRRSSARRAAARAAACAGASCASAGERTHRGTSAVSEAATGIAQGGTRKRQRAGSAASARAPHSQVPSLRPRVRLEQRVVRDQRRAHATSAHVIERIPRVL